ncbi:hypothetical protein [Nitrosomonas oligotropha]|uniref:Uncharacterized protein n=1 Tax=Nitrosomonas oligotropha TaxID=42354 RepID=A0A1H8U8L0_9PROT|nr:hypothetical protein [Nitrosomonas oligotropha]SDX42299.1 hypothetical protein SAMN05216300_13519 [Nitrosomonas oligotropha]SEO98988.1 hypothetical protein SAMN05216333_13119 [Nitrosomonas oligotropha]
MEMKKYIEDGAKKAGNNKALAKFLNQSETILSDVKAGKKGLNDAACIKLADLIEVNPLYVIAASNLVTEKDEEKRKIFKSCFTRAASVAVAALIFAGSSMTSSPAQAQSQKTGVNSIYIM